MTPREVWLGTVDVAGYTWVIADKSERNVRSNLLREWQEHAKKNIPLARWEGPKADCTWKEFSGYFGAYVRLAPFGKVEWA